MKLKLIILNLKNNRNFLYLICGSIFLSLYIFEAYSTFYLEVNRYNFEDTLRNKIKIYKNNKNLKFDTRNKFEVFNEEKKKNPGLTVSIYSDLYDERFNKIIPLAGISNSKTLYCNENGYYAFYESDRFGFNNPDKIWDDNEFELVLLGDSFTQGNCVFEKNNLAGNLKKLEKKSNILNLGYNGNGPLKKLATLREYLQNKKIKKLLWIYYEGNDLEDLKNELKHLILQQYFTNKKYSQKLQERQIEIDQILRQKIIQEEKNYYKKESEKRLDQFKSFIKLNITRNVIINHLLGPKKTAYEIEDLSNFSKILIEVKEYSNENNIEFIFVYLPEYRRYKKSLKLDNHRNYIYIIKLLSDLNIKNIDFVKEIDKRKIDPADLFPFKMISHNHYSELGYQILSDIIFQKINY